MSCPVPFVSFLVATAMLAGCAPARLPMTFGEVPRDGRGLPVWSVVAKKASRPDLIPAADRPKPPAGPPSARQS